VKEQGTSARRYVGMLGNSEYARKSEKGARAWSGEVNDDASDVVDHFFLSHPSVVACLNDFLACFGAIAVAAGNKVDHGLVVEELQTPSDAGTIKRSLGVMTWSMISGSGITPMLSATWSPKLRVMARPGIIIVASRNSLGSNGISVLVFKRRNASARLDDASSLVSTLGLLVIWEPDSLEFAALLPRKNTARISEVAAVNAAATNHGCDARGTW